MFGFGRLQIFVGNGDFVCLFIYKLISQPTLNGID